MPSFDGTIEVVRDTNKKIEAYQHIDNGGVHWKYDKYSRTLSVETSFFGYGSTKVDLPYQNPEELVKFFAKLCD